MRELEPLRPCARSPRSTPWARPELYAVGPDGALQPVPVANRVQAWTVGARRALEQGWDGGAGRPR